MDFDLSLEARMLRDLARHFVTSEVLPLEATIPEGEEMPEEFLRPLQEKAREQGLWLLSIPVELGGAGLSLLESCLIQEEAAKAKVIPFRNNEVFGPYIDPVLIEACNAEQRERILLPALRCEKRICFALTEPDFGSDPSGMRTVARRQGSRFILNGSKRFITMAGSADYAIVFCVTDPVKRANGGISCLLVDLNAAGVTRPRRWPTMMGDEPWEIIFEDVEVPVENLLGEEGLGFKLGQRSLTAQRVAGQASWAVGAAERSLELAMDYAEVRTTFGEKLTDRQAIQFMIADSAIDLQTSRLLNYDAAWRYDRGEDIRNQSYMAKIHATEASSRVIDRSLQILGGVGLTKELPVEYFYRQIRSLRITEGATEVLRWRLARNLLRGRN